MSTDENKQAEGADSSNGAGEGSGGESISISKQDYDKLHQDLGSLKRELKDLKKPKEEAKETLKTNPDNSLAEKLAEKSFLRSAGITQSDEVKLALETAKKWGVSIDELVDDEDFKVKLEKIRTQKSNELATSGVKGGAGTSQAKNTPEYWIAKGTPPNRSDVPDRKTRVNIVKAMAKGNKGKVFYND